MHLSFSPHVSKRRVLAAVSAPATSLLLAALGDIDFEVGCVHSSDLEVGEILVDIHSLLTVQQRDDLSLPDECCVVQGLNVVVSSLDDDAEQLDHAPFPVVAHHGADGLGALVLPLLLFVVLAVDDVQWIGLHAGALVWALALADAVGDQHVWRADLGVFHGPEAWRWGGSHWVLVGPIGAVGLIPLHLGHALGGGVNPGHFGGSVLVQDASVFLRGLACGGSGQGEVRLPSDKGLRPGWVHLECCEHYQCDCYPVSYSSRLQVIHSLGYVNCDKDSSCDTRAVASPKL
jgi:hypothetical protein